MMRLSINKKRQFLYYIEIDVFLINNIDVLDIVLLFIRVYKVRRFGLLSSESLNDNSNPIAEITVAMINVTLTP